MRRCTPCVLIRRSLLPVGGVALAVALASATVGGAPVPACSRRSPFAIWPGPPSSASWLHARRAVRASVAWPGTGRAHPAPRARLAHRVPPAPVAPKGRRAATAPRAREACRAIREPRACQGHRACRAIPARRAIPVRRVRRAILVHRALQERRAIRARRAIPAHKARRAILVPKARRACRVTRARKARRAPGPQGVPGDLGAQGPGRRVIRARKGPRVRRAARPAWSRWTAWARRRAGPGRPVGLAGAAGAVDHVRRRCRSWNGRLRDRDVPCGQEDPRRWRHVHGLERESVRRVTPLQSYPQCGQRLDVSRPREHCAGAGVTVTVTTYAVCTV